MKALPLSERFSSLRPDEVVYLQINDTVRRCSIKSLRKINSHFAVSFHDVTDRDMASLYRGAFLTFPFEAKDLGEGEFLYEDIIGLAVISSSGNKIGEVVDIFNNGAHDVYVVRMGEKEYLLPAVREFIRDIAVAEKRIIVNEIKGLFE
jgi:16S rRNA processing protein RimM